FEANPFQGAAVENLETTHEVGIGAFARNMRNYPYCADAGVSRAPHSGWQTGSQWNLASPERSQLRHRDACCATRNGAQTRPIWSCARRAGPEIGRASCRE